MNYEEAKAVKRPAIEIGKSYPFYSEVQEEYLPAEQRLRRFTSQEVEVIEAHPVEDPECSPSFKVRAQDGTEFTAHQEELNGWDFDLGQFFWPDATHGPDHDTTFLANERTGD